MRRAGFLAALGLLVVVNAVVLAGVTWNRSGQPEATVQLTERELSWRYSRLRSKENSGIALQLNLHIDSYSPEWLDADKLRELGFRTDKPQLEHGSHDRQYKQPLPRRAWVVLEFDGPAWQAVLAKNEQDIRELRDKLETGEATLKQIENNEKQFAQMKISGSRLIAVDTGIDAAELRARYPDQTRYLITSARIRMHLGWNSPENKPARRTVRGYIRVLGERIHVPLQFRASLLAALGDDTKYYSSYTDKSPRYSVTLNVGKRYEPWVAEVMVLAKQERRPSAR